MQQVLILFSVDTSGSVQHGAKNRIQENVGKLFLIDWTSSRFKNGDDLLTFDGNLLKFLANSFMYYSVLFSELAEIPGVARDSR
jgi:hypothetical protein